MSFKYTTLVLFNLTTLCNAANILGIITTASYSHQVVYINLWRELSLRGHNVTVMTTDPVKDPKLVNLTELDLHWLYKRVANISKIAERATIWNFQQEVIGLLLPSSEEVLSYSPVQELIHNKHQRSFDVVLVEFMTPEFLAFAELYKCPKIVISSLDVFTHIHRAMGNPSHPNLRPEIGSVFSRESSTFGQRVINTLHSWYLSYFHAFKNYPARKKLIEKYFNLTVSVEDLLSDVDALFVAVYPELQRAKAHGSTTVTIGDLRPKVNSYYLCYLQDLKEFLDSAKDGFIYFSLGSNVKSNELGSEIFKTIFEAIKEVPFKVLWKYEGDDLPGKPDSIKTIKWAPQQNVLAHPNIKVFVTQGGLQSLEEGIYHEVPFVVIPFFADQMQNANLMKTKGIARVVERKPSIKKEDLMGSILEVARNPKYKQAVKKLKELILDTPMTGLEKAVWWTEYVIRHKGTKHLRNLAADMPFYEYYFLDVIVFFVLLSVTVLYVFIILGKLFYKIILCRILNNTPLIRKKLE
ncbi:hypothetical protein NQ317_006161 [Molorchus minor]|uniref:Glucuronosyltransferase n=1 Tax=Molorchus minor TaxID=1323400 RepID=A0ABQ9J8X3_9CUCU|nr:hypothetical protein NQ317_006161 [Molorchus minor]